MNRSKLHVIKPLLLAVSLFALGTSSFSFDLEQGKSRSQVEKQLLKDIYAKHKTLPGFLFEYGGEKYFALSKIGSAIGTYDMTDPNAVLHGWPLTRWDYLHPPFEIADPLHRIRGYQFYDSVFLNTDVKKPGCLHLTPLRYGDIENDGANEIYLSLSSEHIVFSPDYERIVFAYMPFADDWYRESYELGEYMIVDGQKYQYISNYMAVDRLAYQAHRSYTKLFVGDVNNDGKDDLISWQKVYESNKPGETEGFSLIRQTLKHFERDLEAQAESEAGVTGEYLPQDTPEEDIKNWLAENNLTWSKGYPSKSECPGEEGQLIPEMHDPLLNDPDVLK